MSPKTTAPSSQPDENLPSKVSEPRTSLSNADLLREVLQHLQVQNDLQKASILEQSRLNRRLVWVGVLAGLAASVSVANAVRNHFTLQHLRRTQESMTEVRGKLEDGLRLSKELQQGQQKTERSLEVVQRGVDTAPKVVADKETGRLQLQVPISGPEPKGAGVVTVAKVAKPVPTARPQPSTKKPPAPPSSGTAIIPLQDP